MTESKATVDVLEHYYNDGCKLIRLDRETKKPVDTDWQGANAPLHAIRTHVARGGNVGMQVGAVSDWRGAVDNDCPETVALARKFLPETLRVGKGNGTPDVYVYRSVGLGFAKFKDLTGETLIDLKASNNGAGHQIAVPPSIHPTKGAYRWDGGYNPAAIAEIEAGKLRGIVGELAVSALIARNLPDTGRHDLALALAGYMLRNGVSEDAVLLMLVSAWEYCGAPREGIKDVQDIVRDTAAKLARNEAVTGGRTLEELIPKMASKIARFLEWESIDNREARKASDSNDGNDSEKQKTPPVADRLVCYVRKAAWPLFVDQHSEAHTLIDGQAVPIARTNRELTKLLYKHEDKAPTNDGLIGARRVLDMLAHDSGDMRELHTRAAFYEGAVFYQLAPGQVVRIDENGWELDPEPPVYFRAVKNLQPLPTPTRGGDLQDVATWVNLKTDRDKRLFLTYVTLAILAHISRPIFQATGVAGAGKTTVSRFIKRLLDPTSNEAVTIDRRDFLQKAAHCYILMLDNQNSLPEWFQDTLCRLVTGESDSKRVLYTDEEDLVWSMRRAVLLNGINPPTERGDVQDRTLPIELDRIDKNKRLPEDDFWLQFSLKHPELLGAVFDALAGALRARHTVKLTDRPRLADWGLYAAALYESQGWGVDEFVKDWKGVEETQNQGTLDGSVVAQAVILYMRGKDRVELTPSNLHSELEQHGDDDLNLKTDKTWPRTGRTLWKKIREVTPLLEAHGIRAYRDGNCKKGRPIILDTDFNDPDPPGDKVNDKVNDNRPVNDKVNDKSGVLFTDKADTSQENPESDQSERYFGVSLASHALINQGEDKESGGNTGQGESKPDLSFTSSPTPISFDAPEGLSELADLKRAREQSAGEEDNHDDDVMSF